MAHPHPQQRERFWQLSHCTLRDVKIRNPFWTYCRNFSYGKHPEKRNTAETPIGYISASGLYEGYVRIPWHGADEPRVSVPAQCHVCGRTTKEGIEVTYLDQSLGFCTNRHYVQWWKTLHDDDSLNPEDFDSPEMRYENDDNG